MRKLSFKPTDQLEWRAVVVGVAVPVVGICLVVLYSRYRARRILDQAPPGVLLGTALAAAVWEAPVQTLELVLPLPA
jgi:hypothetical protein